MMTQEENEYVVDYLIYREVSFDLLPEVHDHFSAQIHEFMKDGLSFDEAFKTTENLWESELGKVYLNHFTMYKAPNLVAKMNKVVNYRIIKKALFFAILITFASIMFLYITDFQYLKQFFIAFIICGLIPYLFLAVKNFEAWRMKDKITNKNLNFSIFRFPEGLFIFLISAANLVINGIKENGILSDYKLIVCAIFIFLFSYSSLYSSIALNKMFKSYDKMRPYIKQFLA